MEQSKITYSFGPSTNSAVDMAGYSLDLTNVQTFTTNTYIQNAGVPGMQGSSGIQGIQGTPGNITTTTTTGYITYSGIYNPFIYPVKIKFGFVIRFKTVQAKIKCSWSEDDVIKGKEDPLKRIL